MNYDRSNRIIRWHQSTSHMVNSRWRTFSKREWDTCPIIDGLGIFLGALSVATKTDQTILGNIYSLAVFVPSIAVATRRMHDTGRNGWWCIVPIVSLVYLIEAGNPDTNKYGPDPNRRKS